MPSTSPDWLYELRNHPIFQDERAEKLSVSLLASTSSTPQSKIASGSHGVDDGSTRGRKRKMCLRGSDLIVAVGNKLRMMSLVDAKATDGKGTYKTLETPALHFDIQQMALNNTEKLLVVGGVHHVAVVVLPRPGFSKTLAEDVRCRCFVVAPHFHSRPKSPRLAKLDWHPLADEGSSLIVLTEDGILREYNVFANAETPIQVVTFFPSPLRRSRGYSVETPRRAVSFAFGRGQEDWGSLTVFCLTNKGEVFAACPFMPKRMTLPIALVKSLSASIEAKLTEVIADKSNPQPLLEDRYQHQLKYVKTLERQLDKPKAKSKGGKRKPELDNLQSSTNKARPGEAGFSAPSVIKIHVAVQGPYRFFPEPPEQEDTLDPEATDLLYLPFDDPAPGAVNLLAIAWNDGRVDICFDLEKVEAMWTTDPSIRPAEVPTLFLYETVDLGIRSDLISTLPTNSPLLGTRLEHNHPILERDPVYPDTIYVCHDYGVHCIVMRKWISSIQKALAEDGNGLAEALQEGKMSEVGCMVSTISTIYDQANDVTGLAIVHDVYLSYGILVLTSTSKLIASELNLRVDNDSALSFPADDTGTRAKRALAYVSLLGRTPFELPELFTRPDYLPFTPVKSGEVNETTPEGMRLFGKQAEEIEDKMSEFTEQANKVQERLHLQGKELERQLGTLVAIRKKTSEVMNNGETILRPRLAGLLAEQKKLVKRADKVLQQMLNSAQPRITEAEAEWIEELERMEEELSGRTEDSLQSRRDSVQWQIVSLEVELKRLEAEDAVLRRGSPVKDSGIGKSQLTAIDQRLSLQNSTLLELKDKLAEVEEELNLDASED